MKPKQLIFLDKYYKFAEECDDDFEIMAKCFKLYGLKEKPNKIIRNLETMCVDSCYASVYEVIIDNMTTEIVNKARWNIQRKRSEELTLF